MPLFGCPFCRELVPGDEASPGERVCSVCGVELLPIEKLPPSYESRVEEAMKLEATPPEHRTLPWTYLRRGRGLLLITGVVGLLSFFGPWIEMVRPDEYVLTGFHLARYKAGFFWGGAVGWFVLLPLVATRRTIFHMRGVRAIAALFASLTAVEIAFLLVRAPEGTRNVPLEYSWGWGLYASAAASVLGTILGALFGGRLDDIQLPPPPEQGGPLERPLRESSDGHTVH